MHPFCWNHQNIWGVQFLMISTKISPHFLSRHLETSCFTNGTFFFWVLFQFSSLLKRITLICKLICLQTWSIDFWVTRVQWDMSPTHSQIWKDGSYYLIIVNHFEITCHRCPSTYIFPRTEIKVSSSLREKHCTTDLNANSRSIVHYVIIST